MYEYMDLTDIISGLFETNCIKMGAFKLRNGDVSKYYFDIKNLISYPSLLKQVGDEIYKLIKDQEIDLICGVPIGGLPLCTYISVTYNIPMIIVRNEVKNYGTSKQIEGNFKKTDKCIVIEDVITTGASLENVINILKDQVNVVSSIVVLDRQQGHSVSVPVQSLITKTDITRYTLKKIMEEKKSRLCFSADIYDTQRLLTMLDKIGQYIVICNGRP
jgi:uridine monophosphate synthetase